MCACGLLDEDLPGKAGKEISWRMKARDTLPIILLRAEEVAKMLGCSKWFVYALAKRKELPSISIGRTVRFDPKDVVEFINEHRQRKVVPCERSQEREEP